MESVFDVNTQTASYSTYRQNTTEGLEYASYIGGLGGLTKASDGFAFGKFGDLPKKGRRNIMRPNPLAEGAHSVFKKDPNTGMVRYYETFKPNPKSRHDSDWASVMRYDNPVDRHSHYNKVLKEKIFTPHVHDKTCPGKIRKPFPGEIPNG